MRFSERNGLKPVKLELQVEGMDADLRNSLWSAIVSTLLHYDRSKSAYSSSKIQRFAEAAFLDFFKQRVDSVPSYWQETVQVFSKWFFKAEWYEVYDFLEFSLEYLARRDVMRSLRNELLRLINNYLEREKSGYRLADGKFIRTTSDLELDAINRAATLSGNFDGAAEHIRTAIQHYSNRKYPDYRNSIKESISAVESTAKIVSGKSSATLIDALKALEKNHPIHPALKEGLNKLYGYTSDQAGIRHALLEAETSVDETDALFMLVVCSAFCNYLSDLSSKS